MLDAAACAQGQSGNETGYPASESTGDACRKREFDYGEGSSRCVDVKADDQPNDRPHHAS
jgi:hypothetical protein